jgi:hypothetical protein
VPGSLRNPARLRNNSPTDITKVAVSRQHLNAFSTAMISSGLFLRDLTKYLRAMSLRCHLGLHRPMLNSISRREHGFGALCESCSTPIERSENGRWVATQPLTSRTERRAG